VYQKKREPEIRLPLQLIILDYLALPSRCFKPKTTDSISNIPTIASTGAPADGAGGGFGAANKLIAIPGPTKRAARKVNRIIVFMILRFLMISA
jgi:hypothetical protein